MWLSFWDKAWSELLLLDGATAMSNSVFFVSAAKESEEIGSYGDFVRARNTQ